MLNPTVTDVSYVEFGVSSNRTLAQVCFKKLTDTAIPFKYSREGDACLDIYSDVDMVIYPHDTAIVHSNIAVQLPKGYHGIVRGRSGLASRGLFVHTGTIDETYRGSIGVIMHNFNDYEFTISKGDRIGQFCIEKSYLMQIIEVQTLDSTERGAEGFGSSGTR